MPRQLKPDRRVSQHFIEVIATTDVRQRLSAPETLAAHLRTGAFRF